MTSELDRVLSRSSEQYESAFRDARGVQGAMVDVYQRLEAGFLEANPGADPEMRKAIDDELAPARRIIGDPSADLVEAYVGVVPCIDAFITSELDTSAPGSRGLGRASDSPPRLAGAFRDQLSHDDARRDFGALIEQLILETYCATATELQEFYRPPTPPTPRPAPEVFEVWVPAMVSGTRGLSRDTLVTIGAFQAASENALMKTAERHGLLAGLRKGKREKELIACAGFWTAAAAALYWVPSQR